MEPDDLLREAGIELPTPGAHLLDEVRDMLNRFVVFPRHAAVGYTLWLAASHGQPAWEHATRFVFKSPIKRCGKTRAQEIGRELVHRPLSTANISPAALVRSLLMVADVVAGPASSSSSTSQPRPSTPAPGLHSLRLVRRQRGGVNGDGT
jgi:hypothetical protein